MHYASTDYISASDTVGRPCIIEIFFWWDPKKTFYATDCKINI